MKQICLAVLLLLAAGQLWATSSVITTNASSCPGSTNTTALVVNLPQDKGGATLTLSGTWTGTISFKATGDGGVTWTAVNVMPLGSTTAVTSSTANGTWQVNAAGFTGICMLSSASMTGSATATITPSAASARNGGGSGGSPTGAAGGDLSGTYPNPSVATSTTQTACDNSTKVSTTAYAGKTCNLVKTSGSPLAATAQSQTIWNNTASPYIVDLPTPTVSGPVICLGNYQAQASAISVVPGTGITIYYKGVAGTTASTTGLVSGGAAGDYICVEGTDATTYTALGAGNGTFTNN